MSRSPRWALVGLVLVLAGPILARPELQSTLLIDPPLPPVHVPVRAVAQKDLDRREAQRLYARALPNKKKSRLIEALRDYEKALKLDPQSAAILRALSPIYLSLERADDALACCRKV